MARVLVISFTDLAADARLDRQIGFLRTEHDVTAAGLAAPLHEGVRFVDIGSPPRSVPGRALGLARLLARRYDAVYWRHPANRHALAMLEGVGCDVVVANDLAALPLALALPGSPPVVFDAHEYAPEERAESAAWRAVIRPYLRDQVRRLVPRTAAMVTVAPAIADAYAADTGVRPEVVTNAPPRAALRPTAVHEPIRMLHHGVAQRGRRLEAMLEVMGALDERFTLDLVLVEGDAGYRDELVALAGGDARIRFPAARASRELVGAANDYDVGLYLLAPRSFNQANALPNKLFEFIQARLAVAISPNPEMARVVREHGCGVVAADYTPRALAAELRALTPARIAELKRASDAAAGVLCAERNADVMLGAVARALRG